MSFIETPDPIGPFGARGIGEHSVIGIAPAIMNAVYDAIGVDLYEIPVTPEVMKKALAAKGGEIMTEKISLTLNGKPQTIEVDPK